MTGKPDLSDEAVERLADELSIDLADAGYSDDQCEIVAATLRALLSERHVLRADAHNLRAVLSRVHDTVHQISDTLPLLSAPPTEDRT